MLGVRTMGTIIMVTISIATLTPMLLGKLLKKPIMDSNWSC